MSTGRRGVREGGSADQLREKLREGWKWKNWREGRIGLNCRKGESGENYILEKWELEERGEVKGIKESLKAGRYGTLNCKLYCSQKFYKHVSSFVGLGDIYEILIGFYFKQNIQCPNFSTNLSFIFLSLKIPGFKRNRCCRG